MSFNMSLNVILSPANSDTCQVYINKNIIVIYVYYHSAL